MKLFNSLTRKKENIVPAVENKIGIYACGPTVYDYFHIGNARMLVVFDTLRRYLEHKDYDVAYIQNFTDIDDKMIKRANEKGITVSELAEIYIKEYFIDADGLGIKRATIHPRATEHINEMIQMIQKLIDNGLAYQSDGDVYFDTKKFKGYGKLSHQRLEDLEAGARVEINENKRNPMDFVLWKAKKSGEPSWESPWGEGRPGWHIECSVMSTKYLGDTIDMHVGGQDLIFPHHENEIAQTEGATGKPFARYWVHNGFVNVDNEKMSKSVGNYFTTRDIAKDYDYEIIRFGVLSVHYRNPMNFSKDLMEQSKSALERLYNCYNNLKHYEQNAKDTELSDTDKELISDLIKHKNEFVNAMEDDLNTADAIGVLFEIVREINSKINQNVSMSTVKQSLNVFVELCDILGLLRRRQEESLEKEVEELIAQRQTARQNRDWALSDKIRDQLKSMGIIIEDTPQGIRWKREH